MIAVRSTSFLTRPMHTPHLPTTNTQADTMTTKTTATGTPLFSLTQLHSLFLLLSILPLPALLMHAPPPPPHTHTHTHTPHTPLNTQVDTMITQNTPTHPTPLNTQVDTMVTQNTPTGTDLFSSGTTLSILLLPSIFPPHPPHSPHPTQPPTPLLNTQADTMTTQITPPGTDLFSLGTS